MDQSIPSIAVMSSFASSAAARRLFAASILARLPQGMLSIALVVHTHHLTGSFASAGAVTGAYAIAEGVGAPLLGRLVDQRGQTAVLTSSAILATALLLVISVVPKGAPLAALIAIASGIGMATPPVGACLRTLLPTLLADDGATRAAYAFEVSVVELAWIIGPPLALGIGALWSTGLALAAIGVVLLVGTAAFAAQPASLEWKPDPGASHARSHHASLAAPAMRTLVIVLLAMGVLLGAVEVAVTASATALGTTTAAAPLFALWGVGSFAGGLLIARLGGGARTLPGLALALATLAVGHLALIPASGSIVALGAVLLLAGTAIAPTEAAVYAMVDRAAPAAAMTEAFAWLATAISFGGAIGAAGAGILIESAGTSGAFGFAGASCALGLLATLVRWRKLVRHGRAASEDHCARTGAAAENVGLAPKPHRTGGSMTIVMIDIAAPVALFYGLRAASVDVYVALAAGTIPPAISTAVRLVRTRTIDRLATFVLTTMILGVGVSLTAGSPRFLLAKEALATGVGGAWFLASTRSNRPLAFLFARSLLEGRRAFTSEPWLNLWTRLPQFRRVWRISSVIWGVGLLVDSGIRLVIAYTLPIETVPAIGAALYPVSFVALQVVDQLNYRRSGLWRMLSTRGDPDPPRGRHTTSRSAA